MVQSANASDFHLRNRKNGLSLTGWEILQQERGGVGGRSGVQLPMRPIRLFLSSADLYHGGSRL